MRPPSSGQRSANALALLGLVGFWGVQLVLYLGGGLPLLDSLLLAFLLAALPLLAISQLPLIGEERIERLPAYWSSIATLWLLGGAAWLVGTRTDGPAAIGVVGIAFGPLVAWSVGLTLAAMVIIVAFRALAATMEVQDTPLLRDLIPRTGREKRVFALLSIAAGFGEELTYRGYAIGMLAPVMGTPGAVALSSAAFGVAHGYQGVLGMVRTALMGGVLAWGFLASGSLWPAIIAHALIDVVAGSILGERLLSPEKPIGVDQGARPTPPRG